MATETGPGQGAVVAQLAADIIGLRTKYLDQGVTLVRQYDSLREPGKSALRDLHNQLDEAVVDLYGFSRDDDLLAQLLALNLAAADDPESARAPGGWGIDGARISDYRLTAESLS